MKAVLVLGSGGAAQRTLDLIRSRFPECEGLQISYENLKDEEISDERFIHLKANANEVEQVQRWCQLHKAEVLGVVNRYDTLIPLYAQLAETFQVPGPSYDSVMWFKDKRKMDELMRQSGLGGFRPTTKHVLLDELEGELMAVELPVVVKPYMGAKSRGVFRVYSLSEIGEVKERLENHFASPMIFRTQKREEEVLVEELIEGEQITYTGYVDGEGKLHTVGWEQVLTGRDVGQEHQQLVYRTCPAPQVNESITAASYDMLVKLVRESGLTSTFIFPDLIVRGDQVYLIELNVRIGGYRSGLYRYSKGLDLDLMAVQLALGKPLDSEPIKQESCTVVEVWEEQTGQLRTLEVPENKSIVRMSVFFKEGDIYTAPPAQQQPIARYYVVDERDSLGKAKKVRRGFEVEVR